MRYACASRGMIIMFAALLLPAPRLVAAIGFEDALRLGVERSPALTAVAARTESARESLASAGALPDPRLTLGLADWPVTGPDAFDLRADDMTSQQIGLMQEFPARAKREAQRAMAEARLAQTRSGQIAEQAAVRSRIAQAWIGLWAAQLQLDALEAMREPADIAERTAQARLSGGEGSASEVLALKASTLTLENRIEAARGVVRVASVGLARWLDVAPENLRVEGPLPDVRNLPVPEARLLAEIDRLAPMQPWAQRERVAGAEADAALAERHADWGLGLTWGRRERSPQGMSRSDMVMLEFSVGLPAFTRRRQNHDIAARRADHAAAMAEHEDARRDQLEALHRALADWHRLIRQLERLEGEALPLARDRSAVALAAYGAGAALEPWLDARRDQIELTIDHARLQGELGSAWAALAWLMPDEEPNP